MVEGDALQQRFQRKGAVALQRFGGGFDAFGDAYRVHDQEAFLAGGGGGGALQVSIQDAAGAAAAHLFEILGAAHVAQEDDHFQRLYVGTRGDHVHGGGDAEQVVLAEGLDQFLPGGAGGAIGDLLGEAGIGVEHLAGDQRDGFGVGIAEAEDQRLRHFMAAGE